MTTPPRTGRTPTGGGGRAAGDDHSVDGVPRLPWRRWAPSRSRAPPSGDDPDGRQDAAAGMDRDREGVERLRRRALIGLQNWIGDTAKYRCSTRSSSERSRSAFGRPATSTTRPTRAPSSGTASTARSPTSAGCRSEKADDQMRDDMDLACDAQIPATFAAFGTSARRASTTTASCARPAGHLRPDRPRRHLGEALGRPGRSATSGPTTGRSSSRDRDVTSRGARRPRPPSAASRACSSPATS